MSASVASCAFGVLVAELLQVRRSRQSCAVLRVSVEHVLSLLVQEHQRTLGLGKRSKQDDVEEKFND